jgi:hypothetical protein
MRNGVRDLSMSAGTGHGFFVALRDRKSRRVRESERERERAREREREGGRERERGREGERPCRSSKLTLRSRPAALRRRRARETGGR